MSGAFWGPLYFVRDVAPENKIQGLILCAILLPCIAAFPMKRNAITAAISLLAILFWLFLGVIGEGIGC